VIPDYSITLCFADTFQERVRSQIANLCDRESADRIRAVPWCDDKLNLEISLLAPPDAPEEMLHRLRREDGITCCGVIDLEYSPQSEYCKFSESFSLEIWPRTRGLQYIFLASMVFRSQIIEILDECGGNWGAIVYESSFPIPFWSPERGRHYDDLPERWDGRLLPPSDVTFDIVGGTSGSPEDSCSPLAERTTESSDSYWGSRLAALAPKLNALKAHPDAECFLELMSNALVWGDELPPETTDAMLRCLFRYRTSFILGAADETLEPLWNLGMQLFPNWPGFQDQRRSRTLAGLYFRLKDCSTTKNGW
jgi:hypothetical protein